MNSAFTFLTELAVYNIRGGRQPVVPPDMNWTDFMEQAFQQGLVCIAAEKPELLSGIAPERLDMLTREAKLLRLKERVRNISLHNLFDRLEENGLYSMPIKGFAVKDFYPQPYMRQMGDIDVFIKKEQLSDVRRVLEECGYVYDHSSTHEVVFNLDPFVNLEIHTQLSSDYYDKINEEYAGAWDRAVPLPGHKYQCRMTPEDLYIHTTAHFALHYCTAGGGIRPVIDLWLQRKSLEASSDADMDYVNMKLNRLGFKRFEEVMYHLGEVWFSGLEHTPETERTERLMVMNSAYGSTEGYTALRFYRLGENEKSPALRRAKVLLSVIFMKPATLRVKYPGLDKRPYLYPFYTVLRWWQIVTRRGDEVKRMADVAFHSKNAEYSHLIDEIIANNKALGFRKDFFDKKFYD